MGWWNVENIFLISLAIFCSLIVWGMSKAKDDNPFPYWKYAVKDWYIPIIFFLIFKFGAWIGTS